MSPAHTTISLAYPYSSPLSTWDSTPYCICPIILYVLPGSARKAQKINENSTRWLLITKLWAHYVFYMLLSVTSPNISFCIPDEKSPVLNRSKQLDWNLGERLNYVLRRLLTIDFFNPARPGIIYLSPNDAIFHFRPKRDQTKILNRHKTTLLITYFVKTSKMSDSPSFRVYWDKSKAPVGNIQH